MCTGPEYKVDGGIRREICALSVTTAWPQHQAPKINIFRCQKLTKEIYAFRIAWITDIRMWPVWRILSSNSESLTLSPGNLEITTSIRIEYWCLDIRHMCLFYYLVFYLNRVFRPPVVGETSFSCVFLHQPLYTFHHWTMVSSPRNTRPRNCRSCLKSWPESHRVPGKRRELSNYCQGEDAGRGEQSEVAWWVEVRILLVPLSLRHWRHAQRRKVYLTDNRLPIG